MAAPSSMRMFHYGLAVAKTKNKNLNQNIPFLPGHIEVRLCAGRCKDKKSKLVPKYSIFALKALDLRRTLSTVRVMRAVIGPSRICGSFSWVDSWGGQTLRGGQPPPPMMMRCSSSHPQLLPPRPVVIERTLRAPSPSLVSSPTAKPLASQPPRRPPDPPTPACPPRAARGCAD